MEPGTSILLVLGASVVMTVAALGLGTSLRDAMYVFRRPAQLSRSLLSMIVVMPVVAAAMVAAFDLHPAVGAALIALSVSPVPPLLPRKALKAGGGAPYTVSLLVAASLIAIPFVPLAMELLGGVLGRPAHVSPAAIARVVALTVLVPLAAGMLVRRVAPTVARRIARPMSWIASVLLVAGAAAILLTAMPAVASLIGDGTLAAITAFILVGLAAGHLLGGPDPDDRTVLALMTAFRHPGVAIAIAGASFPGEKLVTAAILLYLLVNAIVSIPYRTWRRRRHRRAPGGGAHAPA